MTAQSAKRRTRSGASDAAAPAPSAPAASGITMRNAPDTVLAPGATPIVWKAALRRSPVGVAAPQTQPSARPLLTRKTPNRTGSRTRSVASSSVTPPSCDPSSRLRRAISGRRSEVAGSTISMPDVSTPRARAVSAILSVPPSTMTLASPRSAARTPASTILPSLPSGSTIVRGARRAASLICSRTLLPGRVTMLDLAMLVSSPRDSLARAPARGQGFVSVPGSSHEARPRLGE